MLDDRKVSGHKGERVVLALGLHDATAELNFMVVPHGVGRQSPLCEIKVVVHVFQRARREKLGYARDGQHRGYRHTKYPSH